LRVRVSASERQLENPRLVHQPGGKVRGGRQAAPLVLCLVDPVRARVLLTSNMFSTA
jgi:hypothetical protein